MTPKRKRSRRRDGRGADRPAERAAPRGQGHPDHRVAPRDLALIQPGRQCRLDLDDGLGSPFAENILREMDRDGKVGLKVAPASLLDRARQRTAATHALEALFAILSADRYTTLEEIVGAKHSDPRPSSTAHFPSRECHA